jgi:arylsulfatase A-like enzyme
MADDIGYECFGSYGSTSYQTPYLDGLARTGIRFEHAYSTPLCTPSRVQIMTGKYNFRNYRAFGILDPKERTFAHMLKEAGYATCAAGKWQLYGSDALAPEIRGTGSMPGQAGFDEHCLWHLVDRGSRYADPVIVENGRKREELEDKYGPDVFRDFINDWIERHKDQPFFVYYPMALVHSPFVPTPDSEAWATNRDQRDDRYFADMVNYMDKIVGQIIGQLEELGLRENTLVMFVGDNGTHKSIQSAIGDRIVQGDKGETTDAGTHVPFIANWPGTAPSGSLCSDLIDFSDFYPTLAEAAGVKVADAESIDGRSFLPQLMGEQGNPRQWIFCHYDPRWGGRQETQRYAQDKRWKLYDDGKLFDIPFDPLEKGPIEPSQLNPEAHLARKKLQLVLDSISSQQRSPGAALSRIRVAPNPYILASDRHKDNIAFYNIPGRCTIQIFNEMGQLIKQIEHTSGSGETSWNLTNASNQNTASGVFFAVITDSNTGDVITKKLTVIR